MVKCDNCNTSFKWKQIYRANWIYGPVKCNKCGFKYKITFPSRFIVVGLTIVPMLIFGYSSFPMRNVLLTMIISIGVAIIGSLLTPFLVKYKRV